MAIFMYMHLICYNLFDQNYMDISALSTASTTSNALSNSKLVTIPVQGNLQESLLLMTEEQINYNIVELNLAAMYNQNILQKLYEWSRHTKFYLKNRYLLEKLLNCEQKKVNAKQKTLTEIVQKYDTVYVNGIGPSVGYKDKQIIKNGLRKQIRARYISSREQFSAILDELSISLKKKSKELSEQDLQAYFLTELGKINGCELHAVVSPNKLQLIKSTTQISSSQSQVEEISQESSLQSPKKKSSKSIFSICFKNQIHQIKQLQIDKCTFLHTKNRCPLVLDFGFSKFIFKDDTQVSHQIISMHLFRYINKIISPSQNNNSHQIIQYQIIPQAHGALYQFVENSLTIHEIKGRYEGGIPQYLNFLESQSLESSEINISSIRKRFAQTFAGFSIAQYLLDLKDRNNSNIMIRNDGSIFHIDLAFIFNATPGGLGFESCPFKFTKQYLNAMGGFESDCFKYYETLMMSNFTKLYLNREQYLTKINIISSRKEQIMCFKKFKFDNYKTKVPKKPNHIKQLVEKLISDSYDNWRTNQYDDYQFNTNKIRK